MIDAAMLLENLAKRGIKLTAEPPKLFAEPAEALTPEDCSMIRETKMELLRLLVEQQQKRSWNPGLNGLPAACPDCGARKWWFSPSTANLLCCECGVVVAHLVAPTWIRLN